MNNQEIFEIAEWVIKFRGVDGKMADKMAHWILEHKDIAAERDRYVNVIKRIEEEK